jgi:2-C-methyl-D-erythritol 4-phosphate cytidylyltransferase
MTAETGFFAAVITAAGASRRMGGLKKEYHPLGPACRDREGKPLTVLGAAVSAFAAFPSIKIIVITVPPDAGTGERAARASLPGELRAGEPGFPALPGSPEIIFVPGGGSRRASVHHALSRLEAREPGYVLIHDGARPWVSPDLIRRTMAAVVRCGAVVPLLPVIETPKEIDRFPERGEKPGFISRHLRRSGVGTAQTPQGFRFPEILRAHEKAAERECREGYEYTDDGEVWGEFSGRVAVIPGEEENRKITFPGDLVPPDSPEGMP